MASGQPVEQTDLMGNMLELIGSPQCCDIKSGTL